MSKMKALVDQALKSSGDAARYRRRMIYNPTLADLGCLPQNLDDISNLEPPWFCHGLAFRMATYSDANDYHFDRWETLLRLAGGAGGWQNEYEHWNKVADHWAKKWGKFHEFLWLLQCFEYFVERGHNVSFPAPASGQAMPDLLIKRDGQEAIYAESYFYSKWWHREHFLEELLWFIDQNLSIRRTHNVRLVASNNPLSANSDEQFIGSLGQLERALQPDKLAELRVAAQQDSPQKVCDIGDFTIMLEGTGVYQPDPNNAHGDPAESLPVYLKEIIKNKRYKNNLNGSRPNMVIVNALGVDFHLSLALGSPIAELPCSIDEIWVSACGINEKLETCQRVSKQLREGYAGSGL
jgi:hypothetical protein